jgi:hypothetical protein
VVTQFSTLPVQPACWGETHAVASPFLRQAVSSTAIPGPIRSPGLSGSQAAASAGSSARRPFQSHLYLPSRACIRCQPSCPAASARLQQFARVPGASPLTYPDPVSILRRCAITRPSTALTCASTLTVHAATSSMLAQAAVASSCFVTNPRRATAASDYTHVIPASRAATPAITQRHASRGASQARTPASGHVTTL